MKKNGKFIEIRPLQTLIIDASLCKDAVINTKGYASVFFTNTMAPNKSIKEITIAKNTFLFEISKTMIPTNISFQQLANDLLTLNFDLGKFTSLKKIDMSKSSIKHIRLSTFNNTHNLYILLPKCLKYLDVCDPVKHLTSACIVLNKKDCNFTNLTLDFTHSSKFNGHSIKEIAHITDLDRFDNVNIINNSAKFNFGLYINL